MRRAILLFALAGGCTANVPFPSGGVKYICGKEHPCPSPMACNLQTYRCEAAAGTPTPEQGESCTAHNDCASGECADGGCCDTPFSRNCQRCDHASGATN